MNASHVIMAAPLFSAGLALSVLGVYRRAILQPLYLYWALFAAAIFCFSLTQLDAAGTSLGGLEVVIAVIGVPACGLSWLLSRALFRGEDAARWWPVGVVVALSVTNAVLVIARLTGAGDDTALMNMVGTVHHLTSSTVLLMALIEPLEGFRRTLPRREKLFRLIFVFGYAGLVALAVIWEGAASSGEALSLTQVTCASIALAGATAAVLYRTRHPLAAAPSNKTRAVRPATAEETRLAARIENMLKTKQSWRQAEIKVGDLAAALGEPDYKVTRAITGATGFANFNRLINSYRLAHAKALLADPACRDWSILSIAMECGFGSIGQFNRAFKQAEGMTPGIWRDTRRQD